MPDAQSNRAGDQEIHRQLDNLGRILYGRCRNQDVSAASASCCRS